ncbi:bifunctional DNA primase/polymerase [Kitasatospora terrestris]|uniref:Bifunctional DNA primase/polymerase n=1 Tax=Kitasatospora terrestris TaxID=258051 RepID=A0ABP9DHU4_9ACTN
MPANRLLADALALARSGVPVLMLRAGKRTLGNCPDCKDLLCGGRPNMKTAGPCTCPAPCHGWAAATTDPDVLTSRAWAPGWREAAALAYHPGGAGVTVVDLDTPDAVAWARTTLPATRTVPTTRGQHWIYLGTMRSANRVRPGVDIKSLMQYARWLGPGTGPVTALPDPVRALVAREENTTPARPGGGVVFSPPATNWARTVGSGCRHTDRYVRTGLERATARIRSHTETGAGSQTFFVASFLAGLHTQCPGPCGLDTIAHVLVDAATSVGVPPEYAARAVANGFAAAGRAA